MVIFLINAQVNYIKNKWYNVRGKFFGSKKWVDNSLLQMNMGKPNCINCDIKNITSC